MGFGLRSAAPRVRDGLAGDVARGLVDPSSPEAIRRSTDLAGLLTLPAAEPDPSVFLASKNPRLYNPPAVPPRPFEADYPRGAPSDASGKLIFDIEGRPLGARYVVGRNMVGGPEEAISPAQSIAVGTAAIGASPQTVAARAISGDAGRLVRTIDPATGSPQYNIILDRGLPASAAPLVASHEVAHAIDLLSGEIPTEGLNAELRIVYNALNNPQSHGKPFGPENNGYSGQQVQRELMAEAIRAYMANPAYLKGAAPKTSAAIRAAVNANCGPADTVRSRRASTWCGLTQPSQK